MIKINKKYLYIASTVVMVGLIYSLSSKTIINNKNTETVPLIPNTTKTKIEPDFNPNNQPRAKNIQATDNGYYEIQNNYLVFIDSSKNQIEIDTNKEPVVDYQLNKESLLISTGDIYGNNKKYYIHNTKNNKTIGIPTDKLFPVISISSNNDGSKVAILGGYNSKNDTSSFYLYDTASNKSLLIYSNLKKNKIMFISDKDILLGSEKHHPEPNFKFDIYNIDNKSFSNKDTDSSLTKVCNNQENLYLYNYTTKNIDKISLKDKQKTPVFTPKISDSSHFLCNQNNSYIVNPGAKDIEIQVFNNLFTYIETKKISIDSNDIYIETQKREQGLSIKFLNKAKDSYYFKDLPYP